MAPRDLESWMWAEALHMLDRADRLQQEFFRPGTPHRPQWQPPVDIIETAAAVWAIFALPGVSPEHVTITLHGDTLVVNGERRVPAAARTGVLHRLEIPHGRFERRLLLPFPHMQMAGYELVNGCLHVQLSKPEDAP